LYLSSTPTERTGELQTLLTSALDGVEWSASRLGRYISGI